jgi:hypothetical protein
MIDDRVAIGMQRLQQAAFANHVGGAVGFLLCQKPGGRHGAREDVLFFGLDTHAAELRGDVSAGALAVVREKQKRDVRAPQRVDEPLGAGD